MSNRIIKIKTATEFTQIPNSIAQSNQLTSKEKGLLLLLMSLPDDWKIYKDQLHEFFKDGRDSIRSAFDGLERLGYIKGLQYVGGGGKFEGIEYYVSTNPDFQIHPHAGNPRADIAHAEGPHAETPILQINNSTKKQVTNKQAEIEIWPTFDDYYNAGLPKQGKKVAEKEWKKLAQGKKEFIMANIQNYIESNPEKYRKTAGNYLKDKTYEDDIVDRTKAARIASASGSGDSNLGSARTTNQELLNRINSYAGNVSEGNRAAS